MPDIERQVLLPWSNLVQDAMQRLCTQCTHWHIEGKKGHLGNIRNISIYEFNTECYRYGTSLILFICYSQWEPGSSVGIATGYGLDGPRIESRWGHDFPHLSRPALGPTHPPLQWVPGLSRGVKNGRGVTLTPHPLLVPWSWKGRATPLLPIWAARPVQNLSACTRMHFTILYILWVKINTGFSQQQ